MPVPVKDADRTFHLPRILCLHGGGTNATIFRRQCRGIESKLALYYRLVYAEAPFITATTPDVEMVYGELAPFKSWFRLRSSDPVYPANEVIKKIDKQITQAITDDDAKGATGEWVAIMGFSQGAQLAASLLYAQQTILQNPRDAVPDGPRWRFAVMLAGPAPLIWLDADSPIPEGLVDAGHLSTPSDRLAITPGYEGHILKIPTIHIHGLQDPDLEWHKMMYSKYCRRDTATILEWNGAHRMPFKSADVDAVVKAIMLMSWRTGVMGDLDSEDVYGL